MVNLGIFCYVWIKMKRLLTYLFIILGLGLMFNVNSNSGIKIIKARNGTNVFCESSQFGNYPVIDREATHCTNNIWSQEDQEKFIIFFLNKYMKEYNKYGIEKMFGDFDAYKSSGANFELLKSIFLSNNDYLVSYGFLLDKYKIKRDLFSINKARNFYKNYIRNKKTKNQIAKAEPSQTQNLKNVVVCIPINKKRSSYTPIGSTSCSRGYNAEIRKQIVKKTSKPIQSQQITSNNSIRLCVSTSFNSDYRFTNKECFGGEREVKKDSDEYQQAQAFIDLKKQTESKKIVKKNKKERTNKVVITKNPKIEQAVKYNNKQLKLIDQFKDYEKNCTPVESKVKMKTVECIKISDVIDFGKYKEIKIFPQGMLTRKLNSLMLSKKAGQEVYKAFVQRGPRYQTKYPGTMILGMSWYEIFYLGELKKNKKIINRFLEFGPDNYIKYKNKFDPIGSAIAKNKPKHLFNQDVKKLNKLITTNKGRIKMREALGFTKDDFVEEVIKGEWLLGTFLNNDKLKVKKVVLSSDLQKRKVLLARYKSAIGAYKKKLKEKID